MNLPSSKQLVYWDTDRWCCDELKSYNSDFMFSYRGLHVNCVTDWDHFENLILKYCPFCGEKFDDHEYQLEEYQKTIIKPNERDYREYCILPDYINNRNLNKEIRQLIVGETNE